MKNSNTKKSAGLWEGLFKQCSVPKTAPQHRAYFAHRYHGDLSVLEQNPFACLFSGADKAQANRERVTVNLQRFFEDALSGAKANPITVESAQTCDSNLSGQLTVLNCYDETPDTKTFRLGKLNGQMFDYLPGQYITLSIVIAGQEYKRSYSLASSPSRPRNVEITVKRESGGVVSNWLNDNLKIGDILNLKGPFGKFSCVKHAPQKILFLAAGSGIVPIMSMLRWLVDTDARVDVQLLLSFRTPEDIIYGEELKLIAAHHTNIKLSITLTRDAIAYRQWPGLAGRVNEKMLNEQVPDLPERTVYLCGPDAFMAECKKNLLQLAVPTEKIFCESFTVNSPVAKSTTSSLSQPPRSKTGNYRIRFTKSGKTIAADGRMTLLELAEKSGIPIVHECRAGNCGECMIKCLKGKVEMTDQAEIDDLDRKKGWVYACCAYPASDIALDV